jgi:hypothetical protein
MNMNKKLAIAALAAVAILGWASKAQAAIVFSGTAQSTVFTVDLSTPLSIVNADLTYNTGENNAVPGGPYFWPIMDNNNFGGTGKGESTVISGDATGNGLLYQFTAGPFNIGSISVYSGWSDTGRMEQHYSVYYTTDATVNGSSTWTLLTTVGGGGSNGSTQFGSPGNTYLKTTVYNDASSTLMAGATGLRFNFGSSWQQSSGVGYREIDVAQAIPEPSTLTLVGLGLLGVMGMRRRLRRAV